MYFLKGMIVGDTYQIWTVQMARSKKIGEQNIVLLDTTVKTGIKEFAPNWNEVMRYKDGYLSEEQYTVIYLAKMRDSLRDNPAIWKRWLTKEKRVAVTCFCKAGDFCHRHLFVPLMKTYLEENGHTVELMGELNGPTYQGRPMPASVVTVQPDDKKIIPFYSRFDLLSNHHADGFTIKGVHFKHVEQFMMYCKAKLFNDHHQAEKILAEPNPQACKMLGRKVTPFDKRVWGERRRGIVYRACLQKALEHKEILDYLLSTGNNILVEASASDVEWGVGIAKDDPRIHDMTQWQGMNLLGEIWMAVRKHFQENVVF
jgi:ribA/ribD-fused uncharacterized protein